MNIQCLKSKNLWHIGVVVDDAEKQAKALTSLLGLNEFEIFQWIPNTLYVNQIKVEPFELKIALGCFNHGINIELIEPILDDGFYSNYVNNYGNALHHYAFKVNNLSGWKSKMINMGATITLEAMIEDQTRGKRDIMYVQPYGLQYFIEFVCYH